MQQRGKLDVQLLGDATGEMICAERVLEAGVRGAGVHQKRVTELPDIAQPLERRRGREGERLGLEADVVPQRVANDLERQGWELGAGSQEPGPALRTAGVTASV